MNNNLQFWIVILALGLLTFSIRASFFFFFKNQQLHPRVSIGLKFIPTSVLAALALPAVFLTRTNGIQFTEPEKWLAGSVALLVAWYSKNILATILSGMLTLWIAKHIFG